MSEQDNSEFFDPVDEINKIISDEGVALPSIYEKVERLDVVGEGKAIVASANAKTLPTRRVGKFEMLEVLERSLNRTILNLTNPQQRVFTALRELSDFVNMATTGAQPKIANAHRDLLPVGHPLSTREHNFSQEEVAQFHAEWMSADPRIAEAFRPLVASAYRAPEASLEREYVIAKLEATSATEVPRDVILSLTANADPYGGGNSFLARSMRARAQRRDRRGRFAWMGGGARIWLGKAFNAVSTLFRFAGYNSENDSFDLEGLPNTPFQGKIVSVPASKVEAIKAILPDIAGLPQPKSKSVKEDIIVDPASLVVKYAPTGWTKVSSDNGVDTFRSADGWIATRYPNLASAPNEPSITRVRGANDDKSINPDLPVYHIAKGSNDGLVTDKPFALTQSWGDAQSLISRYDKKMTPKEEKTKATLKEQPQEFIEGWTKGEGGYIPSKWNAYTGESDRAGGKDFYTDPSGRYVAVKLATPPATRETGAKEYKEREDERTRKQVLESGLPIHTFDGAKDWDGNVDNLYRLERVKSDGKRELLGFYQDPEDIERDTEIPPTEDKSQDFYEGVIADTLQNGGNTIDFVDGSWPEDGYIIAHEADIPLEGNELGKREQVVSPELFADPVEGPKILREFALRNQDKLSQQGFYLGTWLDTVDVTDENGKVVDQREMVFLDVSEYEANFDKAFDKAEARSELAYYGVSEGKSFYVKDEKHRREVVRKTPVFDEAKEKRIRAEADKIIKEEDKWFSDNNLELQRTGVAFWKGSGDDAIPNPELQKDYPEIYRRLTRRFEAEKSRGSVFREYIRSIFEMSDGMDPGGRNDGLSGESLRTRDNYVGNDKKTLEMNKALRDGGDVTSKVQKIDALVNKSKLKDDTQFFRGAWLDPELVKDMEVGDMFFDRAFQSMSLEEDTASSYLDFREEASSGKSRVIFRLLLPKGMNAIHVGDDEVIGRRNTKMRIIRKSELDGTTYFDVDVEPQTKEEINARIQGRVPKPEEPQDGTSSSELPGNDGGGADGLGGPIPPAINYGPKPEGQEQAPRVTDPDAPLTPNFMLNNSPRDFRQLTPDERAEISRHNPNVNIWEQIAEEATFYKKEIPSTLVNVLEQDKQAVRENRPPGDQPGQEATIGLGRALKGGVAENLTEKLKDVDDKEFIDLAMAQGKKDIDISDKSAVDSLRYQVVSDLIKSWAVTSNGDEPMSLAIQDLAKKEFGVAIAANWQISPEKQKQVDDIVKNNENLIRKFLRAQYDATQEYFERKGITKLTLFRGVKKFINHDIVESTFPNGGRFTATLGLRPLSAWSTSRRVAEVFASAFEQSRLFRKEFDVKDILCFPGTGFGCLDEKEMVVIGGNTKNIDVSGQRNLRPMIGTNQAFSFEKEPENYQIVFKDDKKNPLEDITEAGFRIGDWVSYAPIDLSIIPPDDGGDEPELDIFDLEGVNPFYTDAAFHKQQVARNIADSDEMIEVSDSEMVELSDWFNLFSTDELDWGEDEKRAVGFIRLLALDNGKWDGDYDFSDLLSSIEENIKFGGVEPFKKGSVLERVVNGYINREDQSISKEELGKFFEEYSEHFGVDYADSYLIPDIEDQQFMNLIREEIASNLIHVWAETSNGDHPMSHAIQEIASDILGVDSPAEWDEGKTQDEKDTLFNSVLDIKEHYGEALKAFVKAQYRITQEWFEERGIKELVVYRGVKNPIGEDKKSGAVRLRPLTSWSQRLDTSLEFTGGTPNRNGTVFKSVVDVKDIFSTPFTGFGCLEEEEIVVLGGKKQVDSRPVKDVWGGIWQDQPQVQVNNAPISNAPKKMSNTERKRLEREQRKAEEAAAPSPEEVKQQMEQAQQNIAEVAQAVPHSINDLFDQNNPLNILNATNITDDILGSRTNNRNLTQDEMIKQRILFMEPTKEWYDLLDKVEQSGTPFAKEIISRIKRKNAALIKKIEDFSKEEGQAQVEYDQSIKEVQDVLNTLVNNTLARPGGLLGMSNVLGTLIPALDNYFDGGNSSGESLINNDSVYQTALLSLYGTTDRILAQRDRDFDINNVYKVMGDLILRFRATYSRYGSLSATPNRNALQKEVERIYVESFFGGLNPITLKPTMDRIRKIQNDAILSNLVPTDILRIIDSKKTTSNQKLKTLRNKRSESLEQKEKLAKEISKITKEVLSENGLEFDHGVSLSPSDISWGGVNDFEIVLDASGKPTLLPQQIPDDMKDLITPDLKNSRGALNILNEAIQSFPKPVALALRNFLIDNKSSIKFFTTSRGATLVANLDNNEASAHDLDDSANKLLGLGIFGPDKELAVITTVHELVHLIVNGMFRNEMNPLEWAKRSRETNNVAPDGKISHDFVEANYGNIPYTMNGDYLDAVDVKTMIDDNELGAAAKNFPQPYLGKYGYAPGTNLLLGQNPLSHGELLSTLFESLLGGGVTSMMSVGSINPKRILSGTNPDGSPKYIAINSDVFAESLIPYGVSMIVLLNELAKLKLRIA